MTRFTDPRKNLDVKSVIEAVREAITEEMRRDTKVLYGEEWESEAAYSSPPKVLGKSLGERIIDAPLAEASIMGIALGAAFRGMRPIPEVHSQISYGPP
ncbi:MAG: hypothetical protein Ct9H300mP11_33430 [Chloroflexota bacterium]|nr:MAG: hypothetical protein Ct9H300mP11_33430 [Chloroflexota bacterium]